MQEFSASYRTWWEIALQTPRFQIKVILLLHFVLSAWACQCPGFLPQSYIYIHFVICMMGLLAILKYSSNDCLELFLIGLAISFILDIIIVSIYHPRAYEAFEVNNKDRMSFVNEFRFSLGMCILNLILKPFTCLALFRIYRSNEYSSHSFLPAPYAGYDHGLYQNMENNQGRDSTIRNGEN